MKKSFPGQNSNLQGLHTLIHPLFDVDEIKVDFEKAGLMKMTRSVKWSLMLLRMYLIAMLGLVAFKLLR